MLTALTIGIIVFIVLSLLRISPAGEEMTWFVLLFLFSFAWTLGVDLAMFYLVFHLAYGIFRFSGSPAISSQAADPEPTSGAYGYTQPYTVILGIILGIGFVIMLFKLSAIRGFNILGYPTFAATPTQMALVLGPTLLGSLGLIENRIFFTAKKVFGGEKLAVLLSPLEGIAGVIPYFGSIFSALISGLILTAGYFLIPMAFGLFHYSTYTAAAGSMFFAAFVMFVWLSTDTVFGTWFADVVHYWWNFLLGAASMGIGLSIINGLSIIPQGVIS